MEKIYRMMNTSGLMNVILGSIMIVAGAICGGLVLFAGVRLLTGKNEILF